MERLGLEMNGINYNTLLGNTGLFSQQTNTVADELKYKGTSTKEKTTDKKQTNADHDTVEINGEAGQLQKAGYDRPKCTVRQQQTSKYKQIDENGIQEGVQLSSAAKKLLKELKAKYSNMEISVAEWSSDEEQDYYASKCTKDYSVLISPEALEQMAADEYVREKYEAILDGAGESSKKMQEELGDDVKKIQSFTITIDKDGKVSYAVKLIQDFAKRNEKRTEEAKKAQQAKKEEEKKADKKKEEEKKAETIQADSIEDLIAAIKAKLHPEETADTTDTEESTTEQNTTENHCSGSGSNRFTGADSPCGRQDAGLPFECAGRHAEPLPD